MPDDIREFNDERMKNGKFSTPSEYVRQLVREDRKRESDHRLESLLLCVDFFSYRVAEPSSVAAGRGWPSHRTHIEPRVEAGRKRFVGTAVAAEIDVDLILGTEAECVGTGLDAHSSRVERQQVFMLLTNDPVADSAVTEDGEASGVARNLTEQMAPTPLPESNAQ